MLKKSLTAAGDNVDIDRTLCRAQVSLGGAWIVTRKVERIEERVLSVDNYRITYEVRRGHNALIPQQEGQIIDILNEKEFEAWKAMHNIQNS